MNFQVQIYEPRHIIDLMPEDVQEIKTIEIYPEILEELTTKIKEGRDDEGIFKGANIEIEHEDQVVYFDVSCQLSFDEENKITDAQICWASADIRDENNCPIDNDFTVKQLKQFLLG